MLSPDFTRNATGSMALKYGAELLPFSNLTTQVMVGEQTQRAQHYEVYMRAIQEI